MGRKSSEIVLFLQVLLLVVPAQAQQLLDGEFGGIDLGRQLIEPARFPTLTELREAVRRPEIYAVLMMKLFGDGNNHYLPIWSGDGQRLAFQRSDVRMKSSKLLLFNSLSQAKPTLLSDEPGTYDYMFRWGVNSESGFVFARIDSRAGATHVWFSPDGTNLQNQTPGPGRHQYPALYQRTDGIWRLVYDRDGQLVHEAWNEQGAVESAAALAGSGSRGTSPRWSRDGFRMVLARMREQTRPGQVAAYDMVVRNLRTEKDIALPVALSGAVRSPSWSPDEQMVAFYAKEQGDNKPWRIQVCAVVENGSSQLLGDEVVVNPDFESEGPAWEPSGRRVWFFSHSRRRQAYYPLVAADVKTGAISVIDYPNRCTTPYDVAINPITEVPEIAFMAHDGLPQDLFVVFMNHY